MKRMKGSLLMSLGLGMTVVATSVGAWQGNAPTESMGIYRGAEQKAMDWYARGLRSRKKAEEEKDPQKRAKLYERAKEELGKSLGYQGHFDGYLALGQVYLALGEKGSAADACLHALALKPHDAAATACLGDAKPQPGETPR
ncbi:MAG TPA: hypothetical protein VF173_00345 [Thermoanaerobaculia bacterium]|nr:hypothetical protein [Thermoanaerobaculia bacterium]